MAWNYRRIDALAPIVAGVWVCLASYLSPLRSQVSTGDTPTPLIDACLCNGDRDDAVKLGVVTLVAVLGGLSAAYARRVRWPIFVIAGVGWLLFSIWAAVPVASYFAGERLIGRRATAYLLLGPLVIVTPAIVTSVRHADPFHVVLVFSAACLGLMIFAPFFYGRWVRARHGMQSALQDARADQARELERGRIAREMHDVVAHRVSLMVLHAGALELAAKDERTRAEADLIRTTGREALAELRQVLGVLRGPAATAPLPTLADVGQLVEQTCEAGVPVLLRVEGTRVPLPAAVERTAYRVVQEGLTNVVKHAGTAQTEVLLRHGERALSVVVRNVAPVRRIEQLPTSGLGLVGLRERVELLGGTFDASGQSGGGFTIRVELPIEQVEAPT